MKDETTVAGLTGSKRMRGWHMVLALFIATIWGAAFVVSKIGLESFTPPQLTTLRFIVAAVAVIWLPRPKIPVVSLVGIGLTIFTGQFLLQFFGIANGMPPGLTAVVVQTQALFTVVFAAILLGEMPGSKQITGMLIALSGLMTIGLTLGVNVTLLGFGLTLASAVSWALGNVLVKQLPKVEMLHVMVWASLVPPLPALAISMAMDGPDALLTALTQAPWQGIVAPIYLGLMASVLAYAIWGKLLQEYSAATIAPFAMLAPCVGVIVSALITGETFGLTRILGMLLILLGVAVVALPSTLLNSLLKSARAQTTRTS